MSTLLEKAFNEIKKLPETEQNIFAKWILEELEAERKWDKLFAESEDVLEKLAEEALKEFKEGKTEILDFNKLWFPELRQNFGNLTRDSQKKLKRKVKRFLIFFQKDPFHPNLHFKRVHSSKPIFSIRITKDYRAIGILEKAGDNRSFPQEKKLTKF